LLRWFEELEHHAPQVSASATLLRDAGESYLVTAGHVRERLIQPFGLPFVATKDWSIAQFQYWRAFRSYDRGAFNPDIEYIHLIDEPQSLADFLKWAEPTTDSDEMSYDYYFAIGFAATRNKRPKLVAPGMTLKKPSATHLKCPVHKHGKRVLRELGYNEANHIVVSYQRRSYSKDGQKITAPHPAGMSGGALMGIRESDGFKRVHLCGILTEYIENRAAIVATKIGLVRRMLQPYRHDASSNGGNASV
jgi:hypothetical protein